MSTDAAMPLAGDFPTHTHDEWRELEGASAEPEQERERFLGLLWKLYDKR